MTGVDLEVFLVPKHNNTNFKQSQLYYGTKFILLVANIVKTRLN